MKKRQLLSFLVLFLVLPMSSLWLNVEFASAATPIEPEEENELTLTSHASPYYFHVNDSLPLLNSEPDEESEKTLPKSAQSWSDFQDYSLSVYLDKYAVTQGESIEISLKLTQNFDPSSNSPIWIEIYDGFYRHYYYYYSRFYDSDLIYSNQVYTDENGEASITFSNTLVEGSYTIFAYYDQYYCRQYQEFSVSDTGIFLKGSKYYMDNQEYHAAVHLVNVSDFSPAANEFYTYSLETYDYDVEDWITLFSDTEQTDAYGYDVFNTEPIVVDQGSYYFWGSLRLTIQTGSISYRTFLYKDWTHYYYTLWGGEQESNYDRYQFVVSSDKTIYHPGETIKLRTLVFEYSYLNETRVPYRNQELQMTINNPNELAIFWTTLQTNSEGVAIIEFPLDYESALGLYGFEFSIEGFSYVYSVRVDEYEKPVFQVTIDTNGRDYFPKYRGIEFLLRKEVFTGSVKVEYYFGQPVVDADVVLTLKDYWEEDIYEITGKTNGQGEFQFSIDLKWLEGIDYSFIAEAHVEDTYGRTAETRKTYTRMEDILAYGYLSNWAPTPNESLEYYFNVFQLISGDRWWGYDYNPLANVSVKIDIFGVKNYPIYITRIWRRTHLKTFYDSTNEYGSGKLEFTLPIEKIQPYNLFEIRLSVDLEDGRSSEWSTYFRYKKYKLDVAIQNPTLNTGDTLDFTATYVDALTQEEVEGEGRIYIYDSNYHIIGKASIEIDGSLDFSVDIPEYAPEGIYRLYSYVYSRSNDYYGGFLYHSVYLEFKVGDARSIDFTTNGTLLGDGNRVQVEIGDILDIQGSTNVSSNQPYYFEIYKRGLLSSERLSVVGNQFTKELLITSDLGPDFTIMVYTISDSGRLFEKYLVVHVKFASGFEIQTDKTVYEPGDTVTLTITPNDENPMLISTTFIDSAVLAVEPEDDSELAYFEHSSYRAYIGSGSSWGTGVFWENYAWINYEVPMGGMYGNPWYIRTLGGDYLETMGNNPPGGFGIPSLDDIVRTYNIDVRKNISESANWIPSKVITGPTNFTFQLPDNIGEWTIRIVGNAIDDSNILWGEVKTIEIKAFLPFFVEFEPPLHITQDDIVTLKAYVYNYVGEDLTTDVMIEAPGFDILNNPIQSVHVPNTFVSEIEFTLHARDAFLHNITVLALSEEGDTVYSDAKQMETYVYPNGFEISDRFSAFLNESISPYIFNYTLETSAIYHQETLAFYSKVIDISIEGWERLVGYPYGCVEQTTSKLISTALIYRYLNQTGKLTSELIQKLTPMIVQGISRLYNMQNLDGGWGWWSDRDSNIQMTTLAVFTLQQVELSGFNISSFVLFKAYNFIINEQEWDGSWEYPYYSANEFEATIYTLRTLIPAINKTMGMENAIQDGLDFLYSDWANPDHQSPYGAALYVISTMDTGYENSSFTLDMLSYLLAERKTTSNMVYWENDESYYWRNLGDTVEITAYAILALAMDDYLANYAIIQKGVRYLLDSKSRWGWWSTADSSAAIYTLTEIHRIAGASQILDFNGTVEITINSDSTPQITLNLTEPLAPTAILADLSDYLVVGENEVNITVKGTGQLAFVAESTQLKRYIPTITVPEVIDVNSGEEFNLSLSVDANFSNVSLNEVIINMVNLPEDFQVDGEQYWSYFSSITDATIMNFTLRAPSEGGDYKLNGIFASMEIQYENDSETIKSYQKMIGPIIIRVHGAISQSYHPRNLWTSNSENLISIPSSSAALTDDLTLQKHLSKTTDLLPSDLISVTVTISNLNNSLQYFALDDYIPAGMVLASESVEINGQSIESNSLGITFESTSIEMHLFIPLLPSGNTVISYDLLVDSVKNSLVPASTLWGMYEEIAVSSDPIFLMNIPALFYTNDSIYQDLIQPTISGITVSQIEGLDEIALSMQLDATDNNQLYKIRFVYQQNSVWRSHSMYSFTTDNINTTIPGLENVDSKIRYFVEVQDEYGNTIGSTIQTIIVHSTIIPYISIAIGLVLAIGAASIAVVIYRKKGRLGTLEGVSFSEDTD